MKRLALAAITAMVVTFLIAPAAFAQNIAQNKPKPPQSVRLYVFDCGLLNMSDPPTFGFTKEEIGEKQPFAVPCYLVVHPKGTLMWEVGVIPDSQVNGKAQGISTVMKTLKSQLAEVGSRQPISSIWLSPICTPITRRTPTISRAQPGWFIRMSAMLCSRLRREAGT